MCVCAHGEHGWRDEPLWNPSVGMGHGAQPLCSGPARLREVTHVPNPRDLRLPFKDSHHGCGEPASGAWQGRLLRGGSCSPRVRAHQLRLQVRVGVLPAGARGAGSSDSSSQSPGSHARTSHTHVVCAHTHTALKPGQGQHNPGCTWCFLSRPPVSSSSLC